MQFALDPLDPQRKDKWINACDAVKNKRYSCPCCNEEVTVRSIDPSSKTQPYFAHLKGVANADCENFVTSQYVSAYQSEYVSPKGLVSTSIKTLTPTQPKIGTKSVKNLYLKVNDSVWELYFSFHISVAHSKWDGRITINGLKGVKNFSCNKIATEQYKVLVDFNFDETYIRKDGHIDDTICEFFSNDIPKVTGDLNVFHDPYSTGRLLKKSDNLFIGEVYIIAINESYNMLSIFDGLIQIHQKIDNIDFYQIELTDIIGSNVKSDIELFLGRKIQPRRPAIKLLNPLPEKIGFDNTIYVSNNTKKLVISYDCDKSDLDWDPINGIREYDDVNSNNNILIINSCNFSGIELFWQKSLMFRIIKAYTKSIEVPGFTINNGENKFNLIDSSFKHKVIHDSEFTIDSSRLTFSNLLKIRQGESNLLSIFKKNEQHYFVHGLEIDAGSFGYFLFLPSNKKDSIDEEKINTPAFNSSKEKWLNSIKLLDPVAFQHINISRLGELTYSSIVTNSHYRAIHKAILKK